MSDEEDEGTDPTILVVEDEPDLAELYAIWIGDRWPVVTAHSAEEALAILDDDVSVVLLDRRMPDRSGDELIATIRERTTSTRIAMVTGVDPDFDIIDMGFDDYLVKPVSEADLVSTVEDLLLRSAYDAKIRHFFALASKRALLDAETEPAERARSEEYDDLLDRLSSIRNEVDETVGALADRNAYAELCQDLVRP